MTTVSTIFVTFSWKKQIKKKKFEKILFLKIDKKQNVIFVLKLWIKSTRYIINLFTVSIILRARDLQ